MALICCRDLVNEFPGLFGTRTFNTLKFAIEKAAGGNQQPDIA